MNERLIAPRDVIKNKIAPIYSSGRALYQSGGKFVTMCDCPSYRPKRGCQMCDPRAVYERISGINNAPRIHDR